VSFWSIAFSLPMTIPAKDWPGAVWFKWQFSNCRTTLGTGPIALVHLSWTKAALSIHLITFSFAT